MEAGSAEHEPAVRTAFTSQLVNGRANLKKAVRLAGFQANGQALGLGRGSVRVYVCQVRSNFRGSRFSSSERSLAHAARVMKTMSRSRKESGIAVTCFASLSSKNCL